MQLLTAKFNQIASEIESTNSQITALQTKLGELQEFQQQLLSVEQAVQSALSQTDTALMMLTHVDPSQVEIFQNALTVKFAPGAVALIQPSAPAEPELASEPDPVPPAIEQALAAMPLPILRSLAKSKSVDARGTKANLTARLHKLVTPADLRALA